MLIETLVIGSTLYAGSRLYKQVDRQQLAEQVRGWFVRPKHKRITARVAERPISPALLQARQSIALSSLSLGLAGAGLVMAAPILSFASMPLMLYVFAPTFQTAWRDAVQKRRITNPVLDATRVTVCVIMHYELIAALNACLQAFSQKLFVQAEDDFQRSLDELLGSEKPTLWRFVQGTEVETAPTAIAAGDVLVLTVGDTIPANGVVLYGDAWLDQRIVSGDSQPIQKRRGDLVLADSSITEGRLYVQLAQAPTASIPTQMRALLSETVQTKTWTQQMGEASAAKMAPRMLLTFGLTLPFLGVNHAAAFLTTGFGAHLRTLGPYTVRNFLIPAAQEGIIIKNPRALEKANLINTLIFDAGVLIDPAVRPHAKALIHRLRQRPWVMQSASSHRFAIYLLSADHDEENARQLVAELGLDDYFIEPLSLGRATLIERLQTGGRMIGYIGTGVEDEAVLKQAFVSIAWRGVENIATTPAQVVLVHNDLQQLNRFFDLAAAFAAKQGFNLLAPIGLDLADIATTLILHFDLLYSVMFTYAGLLLGAASGRAPRRRQEPVIVAAEEGSTLPALPLASM